MTKYFTRTIAAAAFTLALHAGWAQEWELGGSVGYGAYKNASVTAASGSATVGVNNSYAVGAHFTQDMYQHFSGEINYLYQSGDPFLTSGSSKASVQGESHTLDYVVQFHAMPRASRFRPYGLLGGGGKDYRVTGPPPNPQPFPKIATLTNQSQWEYVVVAGAGVKYRVTPNLVVRGEFRDYVTPRPSDVFHVATGATGSGIFHQFTPVFGIGYSFGAR